MPNSGSSTFNGSAPLVKFVLAAQGLQSDSAVLPADLRYLPAGHWAQAELEDAPDAPEYLPGEHSTQKVALGLPRVSANFPGPQAKHVSPEDAPRTDEYLPASQLVHVDAPARQHPCQCPMHSDRVMSIRTPYAVFRPDLLDT